MLITSVSSFDNLDCLNTKLYGLLFPNLAVFMEPTLSDCSNSDLQQMTTIYFHILIYLPFLASSHLISC